MIREALILPTALKIFTFFCYCFHLCLLTPLVPRIHSSTTVRYSRCFSDGFKWRNFINTNKQMVLKLNLSCHYSQCRAIWWNSMIQSFVLISKLETGGSPWRWFLIQNRQVCIIKTTAMTLIYALYQTGEGDLGCLKAPRPCCQSPLPLWLWNKEEPENLWPNT